MESILLIGDSQCAQLTSGKLGWGATSPDWPALESAVAAATPARAPQLQILKDCAGWRRIARCMKACCACGPADDCCASNCYAETGHLSHDALPPLETFMCRRATRVMSYGCDPLDGYGSAPLAGVVMFVGINDLKRSNWRPLQDDVSAQARNDYSRFLAEAAACASVRFVLLVDALPLVPGALTGAGKLWDIVDPSRANASVELSASAATAVGAAGGTAPRLLVEHLPTATLAVAAESLDGSHYASGGSTEAALAAAIGEAVVRLAHSSMPPTVSPSVSPSASPSVPGDTPAPTALQTAAPTHAPFSDPVFPVEQPNEHCNASLNASEARRRLRALGGASAGGMAVLARQLAENTTRACEARAGPMLAAAGLVSAVPLVLVELGMARLLTRGGGVIEGASGAAPPPPHGAARNAPIEGLRALGAIHIAIFHLYQTWQPAGTDGYVAECLFCGFGKYWVCVFFLISGFVLALPRRDSPRLLLFMAQRVLPLLPVYYLSLVLAAAKTADWSAGSTDARGFALSLLLIQSWGPPFHYARVNGPSWFVCSVCLCWACFPHWHAAAARLSQRGAALLAFAAWAASFTPTAICYLFFDAPLHHRSYDNHIKDFIEFHPLNNWPAFLFGVALGTLLRRGSAADLPPRLVAAARHSGATVPLAAIVLFCSLATPPGFEMGTYYLLFDKGPATLPVFALLLAACCCDPLRDPLGGRALLALAPLGSLAWSAYILHVPVAALLDGLDDDAFSFLWLKPLLILLICAAAATLLDRPAHHAVRRALGPQREREWRPVAGGRLERIWLRMTGGRSRALNSSRSVLRSSAARGAAKPSVSDVNMCDALSRSSPGQQHSTTAC